MARKIRSAALETRTARLALPVRKKPYTCRIANGIRLAYRRNQTGGVWSVLKADGAGGTWLQKFAAADDHEDSNGSTILTYWEACELARKLARGDDVVDGQDTSGKAITVAEAVDAYERDLAARDAGVGNARWLRFHLSHAIMSKAVALLTPRDVRTVRDSLIVAKGLTRATANRFMKAFCACLTLAAHDDPRIGNRAAWKLQGLPDAGVSRNVVLTEQQVRDVVAACYRHGGNRLGVYIELLATTGVRPVQARRLTVGDLEADDHRDGARVMMPSSKKGKGKKRIERTPLPIPASLARRLEVEAAGRADDELLLRDGDGNPWTPHGHYRPFMAAVAGLKLPKGATPYALRHTFITALLLKGVPTSLVAAAVDTSEAMIKQTYAKYIARPGSGLIRASQVDFGEAAPAAAKVLPLKPRKAGSPAAPRS